MKKIMTLDAFNMINKDPDFKHTVDFDTLCEAAALGCLNMDYSRFDDLDRVITSYYLFPFGCYDSTVGMRLYYLNDEPLAISVQNSRKSYEDFTFVNKDMLEKLRSFLKSLVDDPDNLDDISFLEDDDVLITYEDDSKPYAMQLTDTDSFLQSLHTRYAYHEGKKITSFNTIMNGNGRIEWDKALIQREDGLELTVDIKDIGVTLNINHPDVQ